MSTFQAPYAAYVTNNSSLLEMSVWSDRTLCNHENKMPRKKDILFLSQGKMHYCIDAYKCVCVYIYIYAYMHTHTCIYIHIHTYTCVCMYSIIKLCSFKQAYVLASKLTYDDSMMWAFCRPWHHKHCRLADPVAAWTIGKGFPWRCGHCGSKDHPETILTSWAKCFAYVCMRVYLSCVWCIECARANTHVLGKKKNFDSMHCNAAPNKYMHEKSQMRTQTCILMLVTEGDVHTYLWKNVHLCIYIYIYIYIYQCASVPWIHT